MSIKEYTVSIILILAIAIGGYHWLSQLLLTTVEATLNNTP